MLVEQWKVWRSSGATGTCSVLRQFQHIALESDRAILSLHHPAETCFGRSFRRDLFEKKNARVLCVSFSPCAYAEAPDSACST